MTNDHEKFEFAEAAMHSWEDPYIVEVGDNEIKLEDWLILETELGLEVGKVVKFRKDKGEVTDEEVLKISKIADLEDLKKIKKQQVDKEEALKVCKQFIRKYDLGMKLVDCNYTFDEKKIIFSFTADSRVDFRQLVKDLTTHYKKSVRLQQIGIRDELKQMSGIGPCGRKICCSSFLDDLGNITTDLARLQQVQQRGSDRLSGQCGRLKCCLSYESEGYEKCSEKLPAVGSKTKTDQGEGKIIDRNVIKHSVLVRVDKETVVEKFFGCKACNCTGCKSNKYL